MSGLPVFKGAKTLPRFVRDYKSLPVDLKTAVDECLRDLALHPVPKRRRVHAMKRASRPTVYTADVLPNHSYKLSFHIEDDGIFVFRRVDTHKGIDRDC